MEILIFAVCLLALFVDLGIYHYVRLEYEESRELNLRLGKVYRRKQKKVNADRLVKAVLAQEAPGQGEA